LHDLCRHALSNLLKKINHPTVSTFVLRSFIHSLKFIMNEWMNEFLPIINTFTCTYLAFSQESSWQHPHTLHCASKTSKYQRNNHRYQWEDALSTRKRLRKERWKHLKSLNHSFIHSFIKSFTAVMKTNTSMLFACLISCNIQCSILHQSPYHVIPTSNLISGISIQVGTIGWIFLSCSISFFSL
jgi:hypothetical protein